MDRRGFLKRSAQKTARHAVEAVEARVKERARRWIRPPYAIAELDLLLGCTRCGDCIDACPHAVIFPLSASLGPDVAGTPALDLTNNACHLCDDWPCVNACEPGVLRIKEEEPGTATLPRLATARVNTETCLPYLGPECGACAGSCPIEGALTWEGDKPVIHSELCVGCAQCRQACVLDPAAILVQSRA